MRIIKLFVVLFLFIILAFLERYTVVELKKTPETKEVEERTLEGMVKVKIGDYGYYTVKPRKKFGILDSYIWESRKEKTYPNYVSLEKEGFKGYFLEFTAKDSRQGFVSGYSDCNSFHGSYKILENKIVFENIMKNILVCSESKEDIFLDFLKNSASFTIEGDKLLLYFRNKQFLEFSKNREAV